MQRETKSTVFLFLLKVIAYIGGVLFLVFAAVTLFEIVT